MEKQSMNRNKKRLDAIKLKKPNEIILLEIDDQVFVNGKTYDKQKFYELNPKYNEIKSYEIP